MNFFLSPIFYQDRLTHFIGVQTDVTTREESHRSLLQKQQELEIALAELQRVQALLHAK